MTGIRDQYGYAFSLRIIVPATSDAPPTFEWVGEETPIELKG